MDWLEVSVQVNGEGAEAVSEVFNRYSHGGAVIEKAVNETDKAEEETLTVKVYLPFENGQAVGQQEIEEALWHLSQLYPIPAPRFRHLSEEDWAHAWKKHYQVLRVGRRIVVKPSWQTYTPRPDDVVVELDPGMAFGTGLHPSTRLCLVALEKHLIPGMRVLDVGTGSGILAIAAARLGAGPVLALDIDPIAVETARANVAANKVGHIVSVEPGSWPIVRSHGQAFDIVLVNILAETIVELLNEGLVYCLGEVGLIVVSGLIESQEATVAEAFGAQSVDIVERLQEKDWVALVGSKRILLPPDSKSGGSDRRATLHRFFVPPDWLEEDRVTIVGSLVHQIRNVLRLGPGDHIVILDNSGWEREVEIARIGKEHISGQVIDKRLAPGEPRTKITLYQGVLKGSRFEFALQKGTELGIVEFVPLISDRCVIASLDDVDKKQERWQRIILEAAEQSRRGRLPCLRPAMLFRPACENARQGGLSLIPWEEAHDMEGATSLRSVLQGAEQPPFSVNIFVGPEGGFTSDEVELARQYGLIPISLGPRILRAETAGLVAAAAILYELGDLE